MDDLLQNEIRQRQLRCYEIAAERGLDGLLIVGAAPARTGDLLYLANFSPAMPGHVSRFDFRGRGFGVLFLALGREPVLCSTTGFFKSDVAVQNIQINPNLPRLINQVVTEAGLERGRLGLVGTDVLSLALYQDLQHELPGVCFMPADDIVMNLRAVKSPYELERLRHGARLADDVADIVQAYIQPGRTEQEVAGVIIEELRGRGVDQPFATCQSGVARSGEPITFPPVSDRRIEPGDMVHMEINGRWQDYMIDICRSTVVGDPSPEQIHLLETILGMLDASVGAARPGVPAEALEVIAAEVAAKENLAQHSTLAYGGPGTYLGHSIGLGTDEPPLLMAGDKTPLKAGMVITFEPGLYRTPWGGARIEDEILITPDGAESLNRSNRRWW